MLQPSSSSNDLKLMMDLGSSEKILLKLPTTKLQYIRKRSHILFNIKKSVSKESEISKLKKKNFFLFNKARVRTEKMWLVKFCIK